MVVVYAVDRLSRRQADTLALLEEFERHGAGLAAASQPFDTTTPAGRAMLGMLAVFAELQRSEIRERTRVALAKRKASGQAVSRPAFGLAREGAGFAADPESWPIVERILSERAAGSSCQAIADALNADGVPTPTATRDGGADSSQARAAGTRRPSRSSAGTRRFSASPRRRPFSASSYPSSGGMSRRPSSAGSASPDSA